MEDKKRPIRDGQLDDRTKVQGLYDYIIFDYYKTCKKLDDWMNEWMYCIKTEEKIMLFIPLVHSGDFCGRREDL